MEKFLQKIINVWVVALHKSQNLKKPYDFCSWGKYKSVASLYYTFFSYLQAYCVVAVMWAVSSLGTYRLFMVTGMDLPSVKEPRNGADRIWGHSTNDRDVFALGHGQIHRGGR